MNHQRYDMLSIGGFANAAQLSIKALRLYDQLGILKPSYVDRESGYRYYHADQLREARLIRMMRQMDMPLATIRQVLAAAPAQAEALVQEYWLKRERRMEEARRLLHDLVASLRQETSAMALEVRVHSVNPQPIISITRNVKVDQLNKHIGDSLKRLFALMEEQGATIAGPPLGIYHGPINHDEDGPIEVCVPVQGQIATTGDIRSRELAGGKTASVMLHDDQCRFPEILKGYDAVYDWLRQNGYQPAESPREIWHSEPGENERLEVAWLFKEAGA
jgi:DNA-binding transcriptional MerR regulator